jgi:hypothetical protein
VMYKTTKLKAGNTDSLQLHHRLQADLHSFISNLSDDMSTASHHHQ